MPAIISNRMLLLFSCIAAWKISRAFGGGGDFAAPPWERLDRDLLVLGCGRRWRERKRTQDGQWGGCGATFPRAGDDPSRTTWLPARVKQLMLPSFDYFRQTGDTAGPADSVRSRSATPSKEETALMKVQAWVALLTYTAGINITRSKPLCLLFLHLHNNVA